MVEDATEHCGSLAGKVLRLERFSILPKVDPECITIVLEMLFVYPSMDQT